MQFLTQLWTAIRSNALFVAITSAVGAALLDMLQDFITTGSVDFSPAGIKTMEKVVAISVATAIVHLYRPTPAQNKAMLGNGPTQKLGVLALITLLLVGMVPMEGCTVSTAQIKADGQAIASALNNVASELMTANPELASKLTDAASAIAAVTANWQNGSALVEFNNAANAAEVVLAAIPITAPYASLVSIAVAAIDVLIANLNPNAVALRVEIGANAAQLAEYRQEGRARIHHRMLRSQAGDFKAAWNDAVKAEHLQPSMALK